MMDSYYTDYEIFVQKPIYSKNVGLQGVFWDESPLMRLRGSWKLREILRSILSPLISGTIKEELKYHPEIFIKNGQPRDNKLFNPYRIQGSELIDPKYGEFIIVVGRK